MFVTIDEKELNEYIESFVNQRIEKLTNEYIEKKVQEKLFDRVDGVFSSYSNDIRHCIDKYVKAIIEEKVTDNVFNDERLEKISKDIADNIAYKLKENVIESIAYRLLPKNEEEEERDY